MSGPRVLINLKPDLKTLMEPIPAPRIARLRKQRAFFRILPHRKSNIASHSSKGGNYASFYTGDRAGRCIHVVPRDARGSQNRRLRPNRPCPPPILYPQEWHCPHWSDSGSKSAESLGCHRNSSRLALLGFGQCRRGSNAL